VDAEFEHREAARFVLLRWREFVGLPVAEQAAIVAQYRIRNAIDAAVTEKVRRKASSGR